MTMVQVNGFGTRHKINVMELQEYIKTKLLRKDGKLNSAILRRDTFVQSEENKQIIDQTNFLSEPSFSERIYCLINDIKEQQICPICNKNNRVFLPNFGKGYSETCNDIACIGKNSNRIEEIRKTKQEKYGGMVSEKQKQLFVNNIPQMLEKSRKTLSNKYGVDNPGMLPDHYKKVKATKLQKYGNENWFLSDVGKEKIHKNKLEKFVNCTNVQEPNDSLKQLYPNATDYYTFICDVCNNQDTIAYYTAKWRLTHFNTTCSVCSNLKYGSKFQTQVFDFVKDFTNCKQNIRILESNKQEVDIYCEDKKMAFECNGLYWHSAEHFQSNGKEHNRDFLKYELFKQNGIRIFSIMEDEWLHKQNIVKSRIKNILGVTTDKIYARNCIVRPIDRKLARDFINDNHIQGYHGCSVAYGLFYNNDLVSVMTFTSSNITRKLKDTWEISRFCSLIDTNIVGAAGKLFSRFVKDVKPELVVSYADTRWSDGNLYKQLGFSFEHQTPCNYWYVDKKETKRIHRFNLRKRPDEPKDKTEFELRMEQGYLKIYDYGSSKWIWLKPTSEH